MAAGVAMKRPTTRFVAAAMVLLFPATALAGKGNLAVVNLDSRGWEVAEQGAKKMDHLVGGWARQPGIAAYLSGRPNPGALPVGDTGKDMVRLGDRIRGPGRPAVRDLSALGRLLGVDYLLLLKVKPQHLSARLFSVRRGTYAPQGFEGKPTDSGTLLDYVKAQTRKPEPKKKISKTKWIIWGVAAALAAVTIGLAVAASEETSGDLRIRVSR